MALPQLQHCVHSGITIKQEPVETDPLASTKQEIGDTFLKEETPFLHEWELPDGLDSAQDPLSIKKEEHWEPLVRQVKQEQPCMETDTGATCGRQENETEEKAGFLCDKAYIKREPFLDKWEVEDDLDSAQDPLSFEKEEYSSSEDLSEAITVNIEKTEDVGDEEDEEETVGEDNWEEPKDELESTTSSGTSPESTMGTGMEDDKGALVTNHKASCENNHGTKHLEHRCAICNKIFPKLEDLRQHKHKGCSVFRHSCNICHKTFTRSDNLKTHLRGHTGESPYICGVCNKILRTSNHLKTHSLVHTGERLFSCDVCKKTFTASCSLKKHSLLHTGERPYSCGVCKKTFTTSSNLKRHSLLHTGERPYCCDICKKPFTTRSGAKNHSLLHTGDCSQSNNLKTHTLLQWAEVHTAVAFATIYYLPVHTFTPAHCQNLTQL